MLTNSVSPVEWDHTPPPDPRFEWFGKISMYAPVAASPTSLAG